MKKGFTLIELLAVIVILAIIALIIMPLVSNVIESSRKQAFKESVNGIIDSANNYISEYVLRNNRDISYPVTFLCDGNTCKSSTNDILYFKGNTFKGGSVILTNSGVLVENITDGKYCATGYKWDLKIDGCNVVSNPIVCDITSPNDIGMWLSCGNVNKDYTTIEEVLNDITVLESLINSEQAIDYLVLSTNWASVITSNQTAMNYIGLNNNSANTLLADSTWFNAIVNSDYFESVLNVKVPTMTSNTAPSGECIGNKYEVNYPLYQAFHESLDHVVLQPNSNAYIGYDFKRQVSIVKIGYRVATDKNYNVNAVFSIYGSNDNVSWTKIGGDYTVVPSNYDKWNYYVLNSPVNYRSYKLVPTTYSNTFYYSGTGWNDGSTYQGSTFRVSNLQFYGREDL